MHRLSMGPVASFVMGLVVSLLALAPARPARAQRFSSAWQAPGLGNAPGSYRFEAALLPGVPEPPRTALSLAAPLPWWHTLKFYAALAFAVIALTLGEWRWAIAREKQLRSMVRERTRQLELEKVDLLRMKASLVQLASQDGLTRIYNRGAIFEVLEEQLGRARREQAPLAVVLTDLDNFKRVNDTYGHLVGDAVLREFAGRIRRNLRAGDQVGRYGGEELLILMPGTREELASRIYELHRQIVQEPFTLGELTLRVTCSFGVAWLPGAETRFAGPAAPIGPIGPIRPSGEPNDVEALLSVADQALYAAKRNGRNRVEMAELLFNADARKFGGVRPAV